MSINLTDELLAKTKKSKIASAKQVFLEGDQENLQQIGEKTHQLDDAIKDISVSGGASTATAVSYNNETSGMTAVTAQGAIDELATKSKSQESEIAKKANSEDVTSQMQTEQSRVNAELAKKFNSENITQESGESEKKVMSQKAVSTKLSDLSRNILPFTSTPKDLLGAVREIYVEGIEDKESIYAFSVSKLENNLKLSISKGKEAISSYYVRSTDSTYDVNKKGIVTLPPFGDNGKKAYMFVDFSKLEIGFDKNFPLDISIATNLDFAPSIKAMLYKTQVEQETGESTDKVMSQKAVSDKLTSIDTGIISLNANILPFTSTPKDLLGAVREIYVEGIEDKESIYAFSVSKLENNLKLSISKGKEAISSYYVRSTDSTYDVNKKGIVTLPPFGDNGKKAYMFVDFSKLEIGFDKNFPLDISIATNLDFAPSIKAMLYKTQVEQEDTEIKTQIGTLDKKIQVSSKWYGKTLLAIGDSVTSAKKWQQRVGEVLGMSVRTHAKGGIGIIQMVDGDGSGNAPDNYDPNYGTSGIIYKLNSKDVADVDVICIMGFYNERAVATSNAGNDTDMYPAQSSFIGKLNYAIKRIYEELDNANNTKCKIVVVSAHKYGRNPWLSKDAYEDGNDILQATKAAANYNSLCFVDLMNGGGINRYNWKNFQNSPTDYNPLYIPKDGVNNATNKPFDSKDDFPDASSYKGYFVTLKGEVEESSYESDGTQWVKRGHEKGRVWIGDQLHPNNAGYEKIGDFIAGYLLNI